MNSTKEPPQKQRELFPIAPFITAARDEHAAKVDKRPAPIQTADKFNFPLQHYAPTKRGQEYQYAIQDWIAGLTGVDTRKAGKLWSDMQAEIQTSVSIVPLSYTASDGKSYQRDFTNAKGLYLISQSLRLTKDRPQLKEIRDFLASSAAWVELIARDEHAAKQAIKGLAQRHEIRLQGIEKRKAFAKVAFETNDRGKAEIGILTNAIYHRIGKTASERYAAKELAYALGLTEAQAKKMRDYFKPLLGSAVTMSEEAATLAFLNSGRKLSSAEQIAITKQCARVVAATAWELANMAGVDLVTEQPLLKAGK